MPGYSLFVLLFLSFGLAVAQSRPQTATESTKVPFDLKNGERVVFLGNSLFENDFQYGYLELALTTRWPDRDVTFRNLGWTGDNVYGVARSTITNPPTGYELLMEHLTKAQPTLVFVAYGGIEAQDGEAGLPTFNEGLSKLLDKIDQLGANDYSGIPIPILAADSAQSLTETKCHAGKLCVGYCENGFGAWQTVYRHLQTHSGDQQNKRLLPIMGFT